MRTLIKTGTPGWFLDPDTGKNARKKDGDKIVTHAQFYKAAGGKVKTTIAPTGKVLKGETTTIKCIECGKDRVIRPQDAFQVERCVEHQKRHQQNYRNEYRRRKTRERKQAATA